MGMQLCYNYRYATSIGGGRARQISPSAISRWIFVIARNFNFEWMNYPESNFKQIQFLPVIVKHIIMHYSYPRKRSRRLWRTMVLSS